LSEENGALGLAARQSSYKRIFAGRKFSLSGSSLLAVLSGQFSLADSPPEQAILPQQASKTQKRKSPLHKQETSLL
jgi:hypothetical protein